MELILCNDWNKSCLWEYNSKTNEKGRTITLSELNFIDEELSDQIKSWNDKWITYQEKGKQLSTSQLVELEEQGFLLWVDLFILSLGSNCNINYYKSVIMNKVIESNAELGEFLQRNYDPRYAKLIQMSMDCKIYSQRDQYS